MIRNDSIPLDVVFMDGMYFSFLRGRRETKRLCECASRIRFCTVSVTSVFLPVIETNEGDSHRPLLHANYRCTCSHTQNMLLSSPSRPASVPCGKGSQERSITSFLDYYARPPLQSMACFGSGKENALSPAVLSAETTTTSMD